MATARSANSSTSKSDTGNADVQDLESRMEKIRGEIGDLARTIAEAGKAKAGDYSARASEGAEDLLQASEDALEAIQHEYARLERQMKRRIRKNPLQSLAVAAGIGFLVALVVRK
ncbi:MAG: hypothetical protein C0606_06020 [Hyphomicrobiales bacterium]|nr:MAG: hypothetical protein C0606_06020 [Hyphomicrobiales bacterium]